jgi:hypothetical protein
VFSVIIIWIVRVSNSANRMLYLNKYMSFKLTPIHPPHGEPESQVRHCPVPVAGELWDMCCVRFTRSLRLIIRSVCWQGHLTQSDRVRSARTKSSITCWACTSVLPERCRFEHDDLDWSIAWNGVWSVVGEQDSRQPQQFRRLYGLQLQPTKLFAWLARSPLGLIHSDFTLVW